MRGHESAMSGAHMARGEHETVDLKGSRRGLTEARVLLLELGVGLAQARAQVREVAHPPTRRPRTIKGRHCEVMCDAMRSDGSKLTESTGSR